MIKDYVITNNEGRNNSKKMQKYSVVRNNCTVGDLLHFDLRLECTLEVYGTSLSLQSYA